MSNDHRHDHHHRHDGRSRWRAALASLRHGHHHDHGDVTSHVRADREGMWALVISLGGLGVTAILQVVVVGLSGSVALLADTIHNFSDALTAVPLGIAFIVARRLPTRRYTYGFGRAEDVAGIFIVAVMAASAVVAAWQAIERLIEPRDIDRAGWVMAAGIVGFIGNEAVASYRIRVGRRIGSAALVADGLHARTDGLTSVAVVGAAAGSLAGWRLADPLVGLAISIAIVHVLRIAARDIYRRLMDGVAPELVDAIDEHLVATPGVKAVERSRVRWIGHQLHVDADVELDPDLSLADAHDILEDARHRLLHRVPRLADALLHASPTSDDRDPHALTRHHFVPGDA